MAVVLFPPDVAEGKDYGRIFGRNRAWFLGFFICGILADIVLAAARRDLFDPPLYLPFVLHLAALCPLGIFIQARRFQVLLAGYVLIIALAWSLTIRRLLGR